MQFVGGALARRVEACKTKAAITYAHAQERLRPGSTALLPVGGGMAVFVGATSPISRSMGLGMDEPLTRREFEELERFFHERDCPPRIELCPLAHPSLVELLGQRGYRLANLRNLLVRPLTPTSPLPPVQSEGRVLLAREPEERQRWLYTVARGFLGKEEVSPEETWITEPLTQMASVSCYLALWGAEPVGGGALSIYDGVAYLSSTSVLPNYRGLGIQSVLLRERLKDALQAGCDLAMVETTPGSPSQRNLERFGFQVAYTAMAMVQDRALC